MSFALIFTFVTFTAAKAQNIQITNADGLVLNASLELAEGKAVNDRIILLTHGTLAHNKMEIIATLQTLLAERGYSSLAPTLSLGVSDRTGMFDCKTPAVHQHYDAMDEIGLWVNWLKGEGATDIVLAGHSRGGNQTAWYGARENEQVVSKIILIAPAIWTQERAAQSFQKRHTKALSDVLAQAQALVDAGKGAAFMAGAGYLYCPGADITAEAFISYYETDARRHTPELMGMMSKPTLVIAGTEDTIVKGLIEEVQPLADAGKVVLSVIEDADHFFLDFYAEDAADAIAEFLQ
ncbi:alpha/beta hydrolase [Magnetovibrio sp. PR-2]|uniref:alpha/beta hydrolase n=1 Tax=Magnetovibrio sp. PR-2 TaxID=3120356 RepID=UPI002FCE0221